MLKQNCRDYTYIIRIGKNTGGNEVLKYGPFSARQLFFLEFCQPLRRLWAKISDRRVPELFLQPEPELD